MQKPKRSKRVLRLPTTSNNVWRITCDAINLPIFVHDQKLRIVRANRAYAERANMSFVEMLGRPYWEIFPKGKGPMLGCEQTAGGPTKPGPPLEGRENEVTLKSGEVYLSRAFSIQNENGDYQYSIHILEDITEKRKTEAEWHTLSEALRQSGDAILLLDQNRRITYVNSAFSRLFDYAMDELVGKPISVLVPPSGQDVAPPLDKIVESIRKQQSWAGEAVRRAKNGSLIPVYLTAAAIRDHGGTVTGYVGTYVDLRVIKEAEKGVQTLREVIEDLSTELDLDTLGKKAVAVALTLTGAEVGAIPLIDETDGMLHHRWHAGLPSEVVAKLKRPFHPSEGLTSMVMSTGQSQVVNNYPEFENALPEYVRLGAQSVLAVPIQVAGKIRGALVVASLGHPHAFNEAHIPVLEAIARQIGIAVQRQQLMDQRLASEARFRALVETTSDWVWEVDRDTVYTYASPKVKELLGYEPEEVIGKTPFDLMPTDEARRISKLFQPIAKAREPFAGLVNTNRHKDGRLVVLETSGVPIFDAQGNFTGYRGIDRDITERKQSVKRLEQALADTIQAIARTVEKRDPYTASHQQRVAELAVAIASKMGFPEEKLKGIRLGSIIHDIGKIYIPAEILNRSGKLLPAEYEIIKTHPQVGYDIIKNVEFPWPVAAMMLQHHERLDGSGYPQGLKNDDIAPEARILAVADVVEAMTSHRPYRPGLGIDIALEEIRKHKGKLYDPDAGDACISLFETQQFKFQ